MHLVPSGMFDRSMSAVISQTLEEFFRSPFWVSVGRHNLDFVAVA